MSGLRTNLEVTYPPFTFLANVQPGESSIISPPAVPNIYVIEGIDVNSTNAPSDETWFIYVYGIGNVGSFIAKVFGASTVNAEPSYWPWRGSLPLNQNLGLGISLTGTGVTVAAYGYTTPNWWSV